MKMYTGHFLNVEAREKKKRQHRVKEGQKTFKNRANHEYQKTQQNLTEQIEFAIFENCYCFLRWSISINSRIFFVFFSLRYLAHFLIKRFFQHDIFQCPHNFQNEPDHKQNQNKQKLKN